MNDRFNRRDLIFLVICVVLTALSLAIVFRYFSAAFPEASIDFRYGRGESREIAARLLREIKLPTKGMKQSAQFTHHDEAKIFLERSLGLEKANALMRGDVKVWIWRHRWFRPLQTEEIRVDIAPTGELVAFEHKIPEERRVPNVTAARAQELATAFLGRAGVRPNELSLVSSSSRKLPRRTETTLTWESKSIRPAGAPYRFAVTLDGGEVSAYSQRLRVPDQWLRDYSELRSKNETAGAVDTIFLIITTIAIIVIFLVRLKRGDMQIRFVLTIAALAVVLVSAVSINSFPRALADYDTRTSYPAFLTQQIVFTLLQGIGAGLLLAAVVGGGDALYRQHYPSHLAISRLWSRTTLRSKEVFKSLVLGHTLVPVFIAFQVVFYLTASRFGAWSPADIPYSDILNSFFPWAAVLFMGFFPAFSEEYMSRAFSIPWLQGILRSRWAAIILAGFIWGFGHAAYPNQPFWIRGVEVGLAGIVIGLLMVRFGLLPLLVWHYTVDAVYTSLLLFRSNNTYYIVSAGIASLVFLIPLMISVALYLRRGGFEPDLALRNAAIPTIAPPAPVAVAPAVDVSLPAFPPRRSRVLLALAAALAASLLLLADAEWLDDVIDYRLTKESAIETARGHLRSIGETSVPQRVIALPVEGFRNWNAESRREDGGSPGGYASVAAEYLLRKGLPLEALLGIQRNVIDAATWMVRFFTPRQKEEIFVEVAPRAQRVVGFHRYIEEKGAGARLGQEDAERIAAASFPRYGLQPEAFVLKEALSFQQPARLDWLFHFEEKRPLAAEAFRRVSVRVAGDRVTQFAKTVKIPERDVREATSETFLTTLLLIARIAGILGILFLIVVGFVVAFRDGGFPWRRPLRWTLLLSPGPLFSAFAGFDLALSRYDTSIEWQTFVVALSVGLFLRVGFQLGILFLALAVIESVFPVAWRIVGREGRRIAGSDAVLGAIAAVAILALVNGAIKLIELAAPGTIIVSNLSVPSLVATPLPLVQGLWRALFGALVGSGALAALAAARGSQLVKARWFPAMVVGSLVLVSVDSSVRGFQIPMMLCEAILTSLALWGVVRWILRENLLAYPVALFLSLALSSAAAMLQNQRADLQLQGWMMIAATVLALIWIAASWRAPLPVQSDLPAANSSSDQISLSS